MLVKAGNRILVLLEVVRVTVARLVDKQGVRLRQLVVLCGDRVVSLAVLRVLLVLLAVRVAVMVVRSDCDCARGDGRHGGGRRRVMVGRSNGGRLVVVGGDGRARASGLLGVPRRLAGPGRLVVVVVMVVRMVSGVRVLRMVVVAIQDAQGVVNRVVLAMSHGRR